MTHNGEGAAPAGRPEVTELRLAAEPDPLPCPGASRSCRRTAARRSWRPPRRSAPCSNARAIASRSCGSVAVYAHGGSRYLQHDADFCVLPEDAEAVAATLREAGLPIRTPPEDWLLKTTCRGQNVDIIFALAHQPVTEDMLERAHVLPVDSVLMPVLAPTDLIHSLISAFSEHYCDFGAVLPVARAVREKVDWNAVRAACGDQPMPAAFLFLLERLNVIEPQEGQP